MLLCPVMSRRDTRKTMRITKKLTWKVSIQAPKRARSNFHREPTTS